MTRRGRRLGATLPSIFRTDARLGERHDNRPMLSSVTFWSCVAMLTIAACPLPARRRNTMRAPSGSKAGVFRS